MKVNNRILRKPEVLKRTGISMSSLYNKVTDGTFPPPIPLGERAVGFVSSEVDAFIDYMIAGKSQDDLRELVKNLVEQRQQLVA